MRTFSIALVVAAALLLTGCGGDEEAGPVRVASPVVGTWGPDMSDVRDGIEAKTLADLEAMREGIPESQYEDIRKRALEHMSQELANAELGRLILNADGTLVQYDRSDGPVTGRGTWTLEGSTLTLENTERNGEPMESPEVLTARYENDVIRMRPDPEMPFDLVLRRK